MLENLSKFGDISFDIKEDVVFAIRELPFSKEERAYIKKLVGKKVKFMTYRVLDDKVVDETTKKLLEKVVCNDVSAYKISKITGISAATLSRIKSDPEYYKKISLEKFVRLALANNLNVNLKKEN